MNVQTIRDGAFTIANVFSISECQAMMARAETVGFATATVNLASGPRVITGVRNNDRVKFEDTALADDIWQRLKVFIPKELNGWTATRMNERFAVYRYTPGQRFHRHQDGTITTDAGEESRFTVLIYLNSDCVGGETIFSEPDRSGSRIRFIENIVKPEPGMALLFQHELWHEGAEVLEGVKYVLRTDVIYKSNT
jgi:predicted 2-oxoglutarate/Fe(II)-dependent dioxygenase YbiX